MKYLAKVPASMVALFPELASASLELRTDTLSGAQVAGVYRRANETTSTSERDPFSIDPDVVDRGLRAHAATQNSLADFLEARGIQATSPLPNEPQFDLAWEHGDQTCVAEVKSLTAKNEERQLRL